jgi:hypothetical protein
MAVAVISFTTSDFTKYSSLFVFGASFVEFPD